MAGGCAPAGDGGGTDALPAISGAVVTGRGVTLAEFEEYLRTVNNRDGRPYQEMTINAYVTSSLAPYVISSGGIDPRY